MLGHSEDRDPNGDAPELSIEVIRQPQPELDSPHHTIHLLDHDSQVLLHLYDFLSNAGFQVSASSNADDALDYVARSHPEILVTADEVPGLSVVELLNRIRDVSPSTRVILTSVRVDWSVYEDLLRNGGADLVGKPIHGMTLLRAVERVLSK